MPRAVNPDGTPWWVSSGPPGSPAAAGEAKTEASPHPESEPAAAPDGESAPSGDWSEFFDPAVAAATFRAGAGLLAGFLELVSSASRVEAEEPAPHDVATCGFCPVCVAVAALKEHDANLGNLVEGALGGVTSSAERIAELVPNAKDLITEQLVEAVVRSLLTRIKL